MPRRIILLLASLLAAAICADAAAQPERPNVVLVLADDLGIGDLGCYNPLSKIPTPNADRLAAEGLRFSDAHSPSAVCTPTRYALLTGRYAWRTRLKAWVLNGYSPLLIEPGRATIASMLRDEGYHTAVVGKWHLGLGEHRAGETESRTDYSGPIEFGPASVGFDESFLVPASLDMPPYVFVTHDGPIEPMGGETPASKRRWDGGEGFWRAGAIGDTFDFYECLPRLTDEAVRVVREGAGRDRPFFLYFPLTAPHTPWMPTEEWRGESGAGWYGDFVAQVDHSLGRVLDALEESGVADETIVIFSSDNGSHWRTRDEEEFGHLANLGYRGMKADIYEAGHRVPLIVRVPGLTPRGMERFALVGLHDLYATLAELLGIELEEGEAPDSFSFARALPEVNPLGGRDTIVHHSGDGMFALRHGSWKLIEGTGSGGFTSPRREEPAGGMPDAQLYDLALDPGETDNRILDLERVAAVLAEKLEEIRSQEH